MKEKLIAGFMAALMALVTAVSPVLGATALSSFPTFLGSKGTPDFYIVLGSGVGTNVASPSDVAGAVDIAIRLAELSYTQVQASGGTAVTGLDRDGVTLCVSGTLTNCKLNVQATSATGNAFPDTTLKNAHFSGLKTGTVNWNNADYKYHEQVDVGGVKMRHDLNTDKINGTEKMVVSTNADVKYQYYFDQSINISSYSGKGTISNPEYSKKLTIHMLGQEFNIVGASSNSIKMLSGKSGVASADQAIEYGGYKFYASAGVGTSAVQVKVTDTAGNPIETVLILNVPNSAETTLTTPIFTIKATSVSAASDTTVLGAELVVGPSGAAEVEYDATADTSSSTKDKFPSQSDWYITYQAGSSASDGYIPSGSTINVEYRPADTLYLLAGSKVSLPNSYGDLVYQGFNTNTFATITVRNVGPISAVNSTDNTVAQNLYGLEVTSDVPNSIGSGNLASPNWWTSMYLLYNSTVTDGTTTGYPVMIAYKGTTGKIYVNNSIRTSTVATTPSSGATELAYAYLNATASQTFSYPFKLSYGGIGEATFYLNVSVDSSKLATKGALNTLYAGQLAGGTSVSMGFTNKTAWNNDFSGTPMQFRLGASAGSAEDAELNVTTEGTSVNAGKRSQEIVDDSGLLVENPSGNSGSDQVVFMIPNKYLGVHVYFGTTGTTTAAGTYNVYAPIKTAVAVMDTQVTDAHKAHNLVLVGGPCVNSLVADLAARGLFPYTCTSWPGSNFARIQVIDNPFNFSTVKAVVVAGTTAADTRTGATVLQQYDQWLSGQNGSAVEVTSLTAAGITAA